MRTLFKKSNSTKLCLKLPKLPHARPCSSGTSARPHLTRQRMLQVGPIRAVTLMASSLMDQATSSRKVSLSRASEKTYLRNKRALRRNISPGTSLRMSSSKRKLSDRSRSLSSPRRARLSIDLPGNVTNDLTRAGVIANARASLLRKSIAIARAVDRKLLEWAMAPTIICSASQDVPRLKRNSRERNLKRRRSAIDYLRRCNIKKKKNRVIGLLKGCSTKTKKHNFCKKRRNRRLEATGRARVARMMTRRKLGKRRSKSISIDWPSLMTGKVSGLSAARTPVKNQSLLRDLLIKQRLSNLLKRRKKQSSSYHKTSMTTKKSIWRNRRV